MKIYGFLPVYEMKDWVGYCIENVLDFVDHLIIGEGYQGLPWDFGGSRSKDGTCEIIEKYRNHPKVTIMKNAWSVSVRLGLGMCHRKALKKFKKMGIKENDWYFLCDSDEFYTQEQKKEIQAFLKKTKKDQVAVHDRMFIYNFKNYIQYEHLRFFRYTEGMGFKMYGQYPVYKDGTKYDEKKDNYACILEKEPMYHYSWVHPNARELKRRKMEIKARVWNTSILDWYYECYMKWNQKNAESIYKKNKKISGGSGWFYGDNQKIQQYTGSHPKILDKHPFRKIPDVRKL